MFQSMVVFLNKQKLACGGFEHIHFQCLYFLQIAFFPICCTNITAPLFFLLSPSSHPISPSLFPSSSSPLRFYHLSLSLSSFPSSHPLYVSILVQSIIPSPQFLLAHHFPALNNFLPLSILSGSGVLIQQFLFVLSSLTPLSHIT